MARGWGRSEEDLEAEKEEARATRDLAPARPSAVEALREQERRKLQLSLARVNEQLGRTSHPDRRRALEAARSELAERLKDFEANLSTKGGG